MRTTNTNLAHTRFLERGRSGPSVTHHVAGRSSPWGSVRAAGGHPTPISCPGHGLAPCVCTHPFPLTKAPHPLQTQKFKEEVGASRHDHPKSKCFHILQLLKWENSVAGDHTGDGLTSSSHIYTHAQTLYWLPHFSLGTHFCSLPPFCLEKKHGILVVDTLSLMLVLSIVECSHDSRPAVLPGVFVCFTLPVSGNAVLPLLPQTGVQHFHRLTHQLLWDTLTSW